MSISVSTRAAAQKRGEELGLTGKALDVFVRAGSAERQRHGARVDKAREVAVKAAAKLLGIDEEVVDPCSLTSVEREDWHFTQTAKVAVASFLMELELMGEGGDLAEPGSGTTRLPIFRSLGKGRKHASDGTAWEQALREAYASLSKQPVTTISIHVCEDCVDIAISPRVSSAIPTPVRSFVAPEWLIVRLQRAAELRITREEVNQRYFQLVFGSDAEGLKLAAEVINFSPKAEESL